MVLKVELFISGTPGTGKSTLGRELADRTQLNYINVGEYAKDNDFFDGYDEDYKCPVLDEDRVSYSGVFAVVGEVDADYRSTDLP